MAASANARALLAAVSLVPTWPRNLFHSKTSLNGTANIAATCQGQDARPRPQQKHKAQVRAGSQALPFYTSGKEA